MASITSLMNSSSSTSSLYGNRNIISGLASGMDTESMIENSVSGYKSKITSLQQKMTKLQWKQDAYRGLISSMNSILNKYTSFTSSTNLFSSSFFSKAVNAIANGANASKVAVSGKGSSDVQIDRIKQLAQAASYTASAKDLAVKGAATESVDWSKDIETSGVSGSLSIQYGGGSDASKGTRLTLRLDDDKVYSNAQEVADALNAQLEEKTIGGSKASDKIQAVVDNDGNISLHDNAGNHFELTGVSGKLENFFEKGKAEGGNITSTKAFTEENLVEKQSRNDYLKDQSLTFTVDGKTKSIKLDFLDGSDIDSVEDFADALQKKLDKEFGSGKVYVGTQTGADGKASLTFGTKQDASGNLSVPDGSSFKVSGNENVNKALGLGEGGYSNTLQTGWTLEKVLGADKFKEKTDDDGNTYKAATLTINGKPIELKSTDTIQNMMDKINSSEAGVNVKYSSLTGEFSFTTKETGADQKIDITGDFGKAMFGVPDENASKTTNFADAYGMTWLREGETTNLHLKIGTLDISPFQVSSTDTIDDVIQRINNTPYIKTNSGSASYNKYTGQIEFTDKEGEKVKFGMEDQWGTPLVFEEEKYATGTSYTAGQDAKFSVTVNGKQMDLTRSSNNVDLDGYNVTLKGAFGYNADGSVDESAEAITFQTNTDSDKIVDTIRDFVKDYNEMVTAIRSAYTTEPLTNTKKEEYQPLTDEDQSSMSESAIKAYEEKAKTGLLYADSDLSNLYSKLTNAVQGSGALNSTLRSIGLEVNYSDGLTTLSLDEDKLRSALDSDPDKVKDAFTQTTSSGASTDGIMVNLRSTLQTYASTSIGSPGILVNKAGSTLSSYSLNNNELNDQINELQEQIEKWQDKMSNRVDYYTNQFTQLELLINKMNSQSSMLAGLSGGM